METCDGEVSFGPGGLGEHGRHGFDGGFVMGRIILIEVFLVGVGILNLIWCSNSFLHVYSKSIVLFVGRLP